MQGYISNSSGNHMTREGQLPLRQEQQQGGMLDHLSGIDFNQTLVRQCFCSALWFLLPCSTLLTGLLGLLQGKPHNQLFFCLMIA